MNKPSKEEVEGIIKFLEDQSTIWDGEVPEHSMRIRDYKIMLSILTAYRDGELVEKNQWISVKDRLPEFGTPILYYRDSIGMQTTTWDREEEKYYVMNDITHWQPLPTPPTEPSNETK